MFIIKYFKNDKPVGEKSYDTLDKAEDNYDESDYYHRSDSYQIVDTETDKVLAEEEIESDYDITDGMFDDEDSKEGFNWTQD